MLPHDWDNGGGHKPLNSAAAKVLRVSCDPLGKGSGNEGTPCCRTGFCVSRNKEPICDSQIRWIQTSVLPIRRVDCCCSPEDRKLAVRVNARPFVRTQKRPNSPSKGLVQASLTFDFFRLTLAAPAYPMHTAIHIERKSRVFMIGKLQDNCFLRLLNI